MMRLCRRSDVCQVVVDDSYSHDVENRAGVGVFYVRKFIMSSAFSVRRLNLAINLALERPPQIHTALVQAQADGEIG